MSFAKLYIQSKDKADILDLVRSAINAEIVKLELASQLSNNRLMPFEQKYNITSDYFIVNMASEDLEGGDDEYITWAGEYKLKQRLEDKLYKLKKIDYVN